VSAIPSQVITAMRAPHRVPVFIITSLEPPVIPFSITRLRSSDFASGVSDGIDVCTFSDKSVSPFCRFLVLFYPFMVDLFRDLWYNTVKRIRLQVQIMR